MDAYSTALVLLARRELTAAELRARLARRQFDEEAIDEALARLSADGTLDDRRVARALARREGSVRHRGRRRALQAIQRAGVAPEIAKAAVDETFAEIDEGALIDRALDRRLKGASPRDLDHKAKGRLVRAIAAQGFDPADILARLKARGLSRPEA